MELAATHYALPASCHIFLRKARLELWLPWDDSGMWGSCTGHFEHGSHTLVPYQHDRDMNWLLSCPWECLGRVLPKLTCQDREGRKEVLSLGAPLDPGLGQGMLPDP